jgi:amino acid adenylation domain-containing protein/non-ribosomal peptide synthase protein (TIGR01720 family)
MRVLTSSGYQTGSRPSTLIELLRRRAGDMPDQLAYRLTADAEADEISITYGEVCRRAQAIAAHLQTLDSTDERALLLYPPGLDYVAAFFGCLFAGVIAVPAYPPRLNRNVDRLAAIGADAGATLALTNGKSAPSGKLLNGHTPALARMRWVTTDTLPLDLANEWREHRADGDALAYLQYTSGSTAAPKGVMISHANVLHNSAYIHQGFEHTPHSVSLTWLPHFHDMGLLDGIIQPLFGGFTGLLMSPAAFLQRPLRWLRAISRHRVTHSGGPNFAYDLCARKINADERATLDLSCWQVAYNGAEPVRRETLERFAELFAPCGFRTQAFYPAYGLAEATLKVAGGRAAAAPVFADVQADALARNRIVEAKGGEADVRRLVGSGGASLDTEIAIVHPGTRRRCAPDEVGEIWVRSASVAAGYWMRDEETEQTFRAHTATGEGAFLRTGDLGFVKDGELFVTGRLKDLIIIRGRNLYPQDIEAAVEACHPALRRGSGAAFSVEMHGAERLVIVHELEPRQKPDSGEVFERVREVVAEEFESRPYAILLLKAGSIPKTSSGKIQRRACREKFTAHAFDVVAEWHASMGAESAETFQAAPSIELSDVAAVEEWLRSLVESLLGISPASIDVNHSLARYGIDSLATLELAHAIETGLNVVVPMATLLSSESIAQLATIVLAHKNDARAAAHVAPGVMTHTQERGAAGHPLSHGQQALWFLYEVAPESRAYNIAAAMRLSGELDADALGRCFQTLVNRHASLRTTFSNAPGQPVQRVHERAEAAFRFEDAERWRETELHARLSAEAHGLFNLETGPLLRVHLFRRGRGEHVLLLVAHHIIADLRSLAVLLQELSELYRAEMDGAPGALAPPSIQYTDYVRWQQELLAGAEGARLAAYWKRELAGAPSALDVPADRARPRVQTFNGASHASGLGVELTARLKQLSRAHEATLYMTLVATFQLLLHRYTDQDDFLIGSPTAGRASAHFSKVVGYFVNPVVIRARPVGNSTFKELLRQVRSAVLGAFEHQDYPFDLLVKELQPERDPSRSPLFQVMFDLQQAYLPRIATTPTAAPAHEEFGARRRIGALNLEPLALEQRIAQFDLSLTVAEAGGELSASFEYNTDLYDASTIRRMFGHFDTLLQSIARNPAGRLRDLAFLTAAERRQLLAEFNDNAAARPGNRCVHHLFEEQAAQTPGAVAVVFNGERLTYGELNARANGLARHLRSLGVAPETRVAVLLERSLHLIVSVLGVLKAGGAYVPLDPNYPVERISFMVRDAQASILLTRRSLLGDFDAAGARVVCFDELPHVSMRAFAENPAHEMDDANLAYVIFTSGSTGRPKGTMISHAALVNAYLAWEEAYRLRADTTSHLQMASFSFDVFAGDLLRALCSGSRLVLCPSELLLAPEELYELMQREKIDGAEFVPAVFRGLLHYVEETGKRLDFFKLLAVGSDSWYAHEHETAARHCGVHTRLINSYGLTEATIDSAFYESRPGALPPDSSMPIGRAFANTQIYLLDSHLQLVPVGVPGELHVGGAGLSRGYLNRPALTAERFIPHPYSDAPGARLYRSGDLARYLPGGVIELLGRIDAQVKIRGFRVEVGEIETALAGHPRVSDVAVVAREDGAGGKRLVAYCAGADVALSAAELRGYLKERVPEFMLPSAFVMLESIPRTPNGKIDRRALPVPEASSSETDEDFVAPRTVVEKLLCDIWAGVLRRERIGVNDNFFELGGDSILSLQVIARTKRAGLGLTPRRLFEYPTIAALASVAQTARIDDAEQDAVIGDVSLVPIQEWFFAQRFPHPDHWNMSLLLEARERLDAALLEQALAHLVRHHDALRSRFVRRPDGWRQFIAPPDESRSFVRVEDLSALAADERRAAITERANETQAHLELATGKLLAAVLFEAGEGKAQRLLIAIHHLSVDGVSWRILLEDLIAVYRQLKRGEIVSLPPKTTSIRRWAELLRQHGRSGLGREELNYWTALSGERISPLPVDTPGGRNTEACARNVSVALDPAATRALLQDVPEVYRTQINDVLLAALALAFAPWTDGRKLLVELEGHGREELFDGVDLSRTIGWFTSAFPVLLDVGEADTPSAVLKSIKEQLRRVPRGGVGYGLLRYANDDAGTASQLRALPAPEVSFNYLGQLDGMLDDSSLFAFAAEPVGATRDAAAGRGVLFEINARVAQGRLQLDWTYSEELHAASTVEKLAADYILSLRAIITDCLSARAGSNYTPSDFPLARLDRQKLDELLAAHPEATDIFPLSPMQQGMLFHALYTPSEDIYTTQMSCTLGGGLNVPAWTRAWQHVVERHAILRASFVWENLDRPLHVVHKNISVAINQLDWRDLAAREQEIRWEEFIAAERGRGFDLSVAPLMRLALARLSDTSWKFVWTHHHMLIDGWSLSLLLREIFGAYRAFAVDDEYHAPPARAFRDYIAWLAARNKAEAEAFWRESLRGFNEPTSLVVERPATTRATVEQGVGEQRRQLPAEATARLHAFARRHGLTLNTLVQGAWAALLSRYNGRDEVLFGATASGRPPTLDGAEEMVGLFINTLPVRVAVPPRMPLAAWLKQLQSEQVRLRDYEWSSLVEVQGWSEVKRGAALFESLLIFENYPVDANFFGEDTSLRMQDVRSFDRTNYPLTMVALPGDELTLLAHYDAHRFDDAAIERMLGHWQSLLLGMTTRAKRPVSELPLMPDTEARRMLAQWNDTRQPFPGDVCVHQLFERQAAQTPAQAALAFGGERVTYQELNEKSNQLAHYLRRHGVRPESRVGIMLNRSTAMVVAVLGALKAGGAYVPLDPSYPQERLRFMLEDSSVETLLTEQSYAGMFGEHRLKVVRLDTDGAEIALESVRNPSCEARPENLAYVIYTSGSTGRPKGVLVAHRSVCNLAAAQIKLFAIDAKSRVLQFASFSFDASISEIFTALIAGATLCLARKEALLPGREFVELLREHAITTLTLPPTFLLAAAPDDLRALRTVVAAGEACPREAVERWATPSRRFLNAYGPTEITVCASAAECSTAEAKPHIGRAIANTEIYILDERMQPVPVGVYGEIYVGGAGLARGYLNRAGATAAAFVPHPFSREAGTRLYRTGDAARYLADGNIDFAGRVDQQVKIRGFRIEPGEIEAALRQHAGVREAAVVERESNAGERRLVAYAAAAGDSNLSGADLRRWLKDKLPDYMMPSAFVLVEQLPHTPSGKIDRARLPAPETSTTESAENFIAPRTPVEEALAGVWSEVLGVERVGAEDNFFDLGGHSLLATRVLSHVRRLFRRELPLQVVFEATTVAKLARAVVESETQPGQTEKIARVLLKLKSISPDEMQTALAERRKERNNA